MPIKSSCAHFGIFTFLILPTVQELEPIGDTILRFAAYWFEIEYQNISRAHYEIKKRKFLSNDIF